MKKKFIIKVLEEVSQELDLVLTPIQSNSTIRISNKDLSKLIIGNQWPINSASAYLIAKNKALAYEVLKKYQIDAIEHYAFYRPDQIRFTEHQWANMLDMARSLDFKLVCKPNGGGGGDDLFLVNSEIEFEKAIYHIFERYSVVSLSPYYEIDVEYRIVVLSDEPVLIFVKRKPSITGDGKSTLSELLEKIPSMNLSKLIELEKKYGLDSIPAQGQVIGLGWQHNLSTGAKAELVEDEDLKQKLIAIALQAAQCIQIQFGSVDIAQLSDGSLKVIEINGAVATEKFASSGEQQYQMAKSIYKKVLMKVLEIN